MPIIIEKDKDHKRHNASDSIAVRHDDDDQQEFRVKLADGVLDILDFKVYRVSKPDFYTGVVTKALVGEVFYVNEDVDGLKEDSGADSRAHGDGNFRRIDQLRIEQLESRTKCADQRRDIIHQVAGGQLEMLRLKHGQSLAEQLRAPSLDEVLKFSAEFIQLNPDRLPSEFLKLEKAIREFQVSVASRFDASMRSCRCMLR